MLTSKYSFSAALISTALLCSCIQEANAGELLTSPRRISNSNSYSGTRQVRPSTKSSHDLDRSRADRSISSLKNSSALEYRIVEKEQADVAYQAKLAKWEAQVARAEERDREKQLKDEERKEREIERQAEKNRRDADRLRRQGDRRDHSSGMRNLFSRSERSSVVEDGQTSGQKAESYFGSSSTANGGDAQKPKLTFWQRLKRAFFGGQ
jgi:hypothetical protein